MKDLIELLSARERKFLQIILLAFCLALLFSVFVFSWEKNRVKHLATQLTSRKVSLEQAKRANEDSQILWHQWTQASRDLEDLKKNWLYQGNGPERQMRLDLEKIISQAGIDHSPLQYSYQEVGKGAIKKVSFSFRFSGSYLAFRDLVARFETFPRFLFLEKVDFQGMAEKGKNLELKLTVAGFYVD